ncbi:MAG: HD domain-containing protein [Bacteroidota bacterium]
MKDLSDWPLPEELIASMKATEQNPKYHAEGSVWNHTLMVMEMLEKHQSEFDLTEEELNILRWAVVLHDVGKPAATKWENNRWTSHGHEKMGLPIARNILMGQQDMDATTRRSILDLVKFHSLPMKWGLKNRAFSYYQKLAVQTDIRLLGIFSYFDILGRECQNHQQIIDLLKHFNETIVPKIQFEWGSYRDIQATFEKAPLQLKNAMWNATKFEDTALLGKLLNSELPRAEIPAFQVVMTLALPKTSVQPFVDQHLSHYRPFPLEETQITGRDAHDQETLMRAAKHFISVFGRAGKHLHLQGNILDPSTRTYLTEYCRQLRGRVSYIFFEEKDDRVSADGMSLPQLSLDYPHPWEAHKLEIA